MRTQIRRGLILVFLVLVISSSRLGHGQTVDETAKFISDMSSMYGFVRTPACTHSGKESTEDVAMRMTEIYTILPTGRRLGAVEFNHGRNAMQTGYTQFALRDIAQVEFVDSESREHGHTFHATRFTCKAGTACISKTSFCAGPVPERRALLSRDVLLFQRSSDAQRVTKAFLHFLGLVQAKEKSAPF